jgi:hypothetical protein
MLSSDDTVESELKSENTVKPRIKVAVDNQPRGQLQITLQGPFTMEEISHKNYIQYTILFKRL